MQRQWSVYAVNNDYDNSIASANSEDEMMFDEEMEDFAEQMEFTGELDQGHLWYHPAQAHQE